MWRKGNTPTLLVGIKIGTATVGGCFSKNWRQNYHMIQQLYFWVFIQRNENTNSKRYMYSHFHCSIIYNSEDMQITCVQHTHKYNIIQSFVTTWMDLAGIMLSEISQRKKDKYCIIPFMCGIKQTNKQSSQIQRTDWWLPEAWGWGGRNG